ncbi:DUF4112 domain-containing protein [Arachnia propionica]|uniref:DUF4112 domain-containing protein n=1 Tax=Arachnia propionica TaxID=1750 RepID=A0A3P1T9A8_9ACTN|nr:DUF4112 domain-containing protein [Arachnia propionica]RRD06034.1 DUF4112 domain-containing protein [Arachnia propionica]
MTTPHPASRPDAPSSLSKGLSRWLDEAFQVPGTNFRFGLDPLLSLIPLAGSAVPAVLGSTILFDAIRLRAPLPVLARMVLNYGIDWIIGSIPLIGNIFDFTWRSNTKNVKLLERTLADREQVRRATVKYWITALVLVVGSLIGLLVLSITLVVWFLGWLLGNR